MRFPAICLIVLLVAAAAGAAEPEIGVPIRYQLPTAGPLPQTWRVTLAIVDADDPDWIISTFVRGAARTVTAENGGAFTDTWDGLDENLMPVPPGDYAVKGILMPAQTWAADGQPHTLRARYLGGPCSFLPPDDSFRPMIHGDPVGSPVGDIAVPPDWSSRAVFQWYYLENGTNPFFVDLEQAVGYGQLAEAFSSHGAGGGNASCTDGERVWSFCVDGEVPFIYRPDAPFGSGHGHVRNQVWVTEGALGGLACWRDPGADETTVFVAMGAKLQRKDGRVSREPAGQERLDVVVALAGSDASELARIPLVDPVALCAHERTLYALHGSDGGFVISSVPLVDGLPHGEWTRVFRIRGDVRPTDAARDSRGRWYVCDPEADHVYRLDDRGGIAKTFGSLRLPSGKYDPGALIDPQRIACWRDADGSDRVIVNEIGGPNRISEWSPEGELLREWTTLHARCNVGVGIDPQRPEHLYIPGANGWLTRFRCDYRGGSYVIDAVWPIGGDGSQPYLAHWNGGTYLAYGKGLQVYRIDDYDLRPVGGITQHQGVNVRWHDADGDGVIDSGETEPADSPPGVMHAFWGQTWSRDLDLLAIGLGTRDVWRLRPERADAAGNPVFGDWELLLTDPIFAARADGSATPTRGGNELSDVFSSDWSRVQTTPAGDVYVLARSGHAFSANRGAQQKLTRYVPDAAGGLEARWRVGRAALTGSAGEITGGINLWPPAHGLIGFADQTRGGYHVYTEDGLFVDTLFLDGSHQYESVYGISGEFFAGQHFQDPQDGTVYLVMGKATPVFFEAEGWAEHGIRALELIDRELSITAAQTAFPPTIALQVRGGSGSAQALRVLPAAGGAPALDGGMAGWESVSPMRLAHTGEQVEARMQYDPETLYLRIEMQLAEPFTATPLAPLDSCFIHDRGASTVSLYLQGDVAAGPGESGGRPGDLRIVFGVFDDAGTTRPVALGLYPSYQGPDARPTVYASPVGRCAFEHVGEIVTATVHHQIEDEGKRLVIAAAIPRQALPPELPTLMGMQTTLNLEATLRGHKKFWWAGGALANRETNDAPSEARLYPGSWARAEFVALDRLPLHAWQVCGPFGGEPAKAFALDLGGPMKAVCDRYFAAASFPPDGGRVDLAAEYRGEQVQGYWGDPGLVRWQPRLAEIGTDHVVMAPAGQLWYAAQWLHVPEDLSIGARLLGHPQTTAHWLLNGDGIVAEEQDGEPLVQLAQLPLRAGWNQLFLRAHCVGYPPFRFGLVLEGPPDQLWRIRSSSTPPQ